MPPRPRGSPRSRMARACSLSFVALAGVLIALQAGGAAVGWGFQLQQPLFVTLLALLMFAVGLNLSGLYEIGGGALAGAGETAHPRVRRGRELLHRRARRRRRDALHGAVHGRGDGLRADPERRVRARGVLSRSVSVSRCRSCCSASSRARSALLPKPGAWMISLRQILAFPMYGAAIWLVWVLSLQAGPDGLLVGAGLRARARLWPLGARPRANVGRLRPQVGLRHGCDRCARRRRAHRVRGTALLARRRWPRRGDRRKRHRL